MAEEKKEQPTEPRPYRIVDRRTFTPEGEVREEYKDQVSQEAAKRQAEEQIRQAQQEKVSAEDKKSLKDRIFSKKKAAGRQPEEQEITFSNFLYSLGTQALLHLGEIPYPDTQRRDIDLVGAKHSIDILGILEEKTKGNLTREEDRALKDLLYDLRLRYVKASRSA